MKRFLPAAATLLLLGPLVSSAQARDDGRYSSVAPDIKAWVEGLKDAAGVGCCATADGFKPEEVEWDMAGNEYRVRHNGVWLSVPPSAVVKEPNRLGFAMVWYYFRSGIPIVRCFFRARAVEARSGNVVVKPRFRDL